jgi:hypothetical protein
MSVMAMLRQQPQGQRLWLHSGQGSKGGKNAQHRKAKEEHCHQLRCLYPHEVDFSGHRSGSHSSRQCVLGCCIFVWRSGYDTKTRRKTP